MNTSQNKRIKIIVLLILFIISSCSSPTEPDNKPENKFIGQVVHEVAYAVLKPDNTLWTWGHNSAGTLGNGSLENSDIPGQILENIVAIDFTEGIGVSADRDGNIYFWGDHVIWLEPPPLDTIVTVPVTISFLKDVKSINLMSSDFHLLKKDGTVWHIKHDHNSPTKFIKPVKFDCINDVRSISESLVLKNDGTLDELRHSEPGEGGFIDGIYNVSALANVYVRRTVILKKDSTVWAWGKNNLGQLGNGTFEDSEISVKVKNLTDVIAISANYDYNLALKKDGTVWFWGFEGRDENNIPFGRNIPVKIESLDNVALIYADYKSIVMKEDCTYWIFDSEDRVPIQVPFD